jgi:multidrug resistance efflux pump
MCSFRNCVWISLSILGLLLRLEAAEVVPEIRLRVQTFAQETVAVPNPIRWALFEFRIPEGTQVSKGDLLFRIDLSGPESRRLSADNRLTRARNNALQQVGAIEDQITALEDTRASRRDEIKVLAARREWLKSLPREEDVAVAEGRLEVARRNLAAAQVELETAKARREKELVSPAMVQAAELAYRLQEARTQFAERSLATERQPAHPDDLRILDLQIENLDREIKKLDGEITSKGELLRIEKAARQREIESLETERAEAEEELRHGEVRAPRDGVVLYTPSLKRELASGGQPVKDMNLVEIPIPESLALRGTLPEHFRPLFREGDPVQIRLNTSSERLLLGKVASISPFSKDAAEGDSDQASGVKWVDVVITLDSLPKDLPFGVYGWAEIRAATGRDGPSVPLEWVRYREGKAHVAVNKRFQAVEGAIVGSVFVLDPPFPPLESIGPEGEWAQNDAGSSTMDTDRFSASGELTPLESVWVVAPPLRSWDLKISWLAPENQWVAQGAKIAELDSERIRTRLRETARDAKRAEEEREAAAEDLIVRKREAQFKIEGAETLLEVRRLEEKLLLAGVNATALYQARLEASTSRLQLEAAKRDLEHAKATPELLAPAEIRRRERDLHRRTLQAEKAEQELKLASQGADPVAKSLASLAVLRQESEVAEIRADSQRSVSGAESRLRHRIRRERSQNERSLRAKQEVESMVLTAPSEGLLKYERIWDGVGQSKVRPGLGIWSGTRLLGLSDARRLVVRVDVPERYVNLLQEGMKVQLRIPSEGNRTWAGQLRKLNVILQPAEVSALRVSPYANHEPPHEQVLTVEVLVEETPSSPLKPGAIAHVIFPFAK